MYNSIRKGDYDHADPLFHFDIDQITSQKSDLLKRVQIENGWHYRMPTTATSAQKSLGRISLNVAGNKQLIERLDVIAHKYGIYYKTPQGSSDWNERNDPVTVYINNPDLTPEQIEDLKQEIVSETEPFIRSNEGFGLYGDNISEGVEYGPESSSEKIQEILKEALEINQDLHDAIESYFTKGEKLKSSVGQNMAAQKLINRLKDAGAETI
jgi:hypothetical protein